MYLPSQHMTALDMLPNKPEHHVDVVIGASVFLRGTLNLPSQHIE